MRLSAEQIAQFDRDGYLFFPGLFSPEETRALTAAVPELYAAARPTTCAKRLGRGAHELRRPPVQQPFARPSWRGIRAWSSRWRICSAKLYMHQFKINGKMAFEGDVWQWHQDYGTWKNDDLMPTERAMNVAIFLDDVNPFNGPLMFIPGSHKKGVVDARHDLTTTSYPLWTVDNDLIAQLVERAGGKNGGIVAPGPAGSMILFHSLPGACLGEQPVSPWNRVSVYLSLCAVSNHIRRFKRPEYIAHRDFTPSNACPTTACSGTIPWTCPGRTACRPAALQTTSVPFDRRRRPHEPVRQTPAAPGRRQTGARRPDRRRQVRLHVPGADSAHPGVHLAGIADLSPEAAPPTSRRGLGNRPQPSGQPSMPSGEDQATPRQRRLAGAGAAPAIDVIVECTGHPASRRSTIACGVQGRQARRQRDGRGRRLLRSAAGAPGGRRRLLAARFGDQPALICDLVDWARTCGFPVVAAGRGHKVAAAFLRVHARDGVGPLRPDARAGGARRAEPKMFNSFLDGSKPSIEGPRCPTPPAWACRPTACSTRPPAWKTSRT